MYFPQQKAPFGRETKGARLIIMKKRFGLSKRCKPNTHTMPNHK